MRIRDIKENDVQACADIYNYYVKNSCFTLEEEELSFPEYDKRVKSVIKNYPFLVAENAENGGEILGFAYLSAFNERSGYRYTANLSVYVKNDCRHAHTGQRLYDEIEKRAATLGIKNVVSIITSANDASVKFHRKNGFLAEGRLCGVAEKFGNVYDVIFMRKEIK